MASRARVGGRHVSTSRIRRGRWRALAGSLSWGGLYNTYFWIDPARGIAGVVMMQFRPFADTKALAIYDTFERGVYQLSDASSN
jgi:CubicO group peptidase (beta-lactamase class C family)